ncbi:MULTISPECIES: cobalamin B12-binding domain-containing protein [Streptomyces]|uniref:Cobalamin B12-binding domain-containing protein n=1 Tax=Streptomyces hyderabadensis TaxID=598549 RepID=A0ABP9HHE2_9ACTN|nr:cobalamin-dependent protein [Streptomyces hyderabadensis]
MIQSDSLQPRARTVTPGGTVIVSTVASDAHTWNLVFLQLLLEEAGYDVVNLGPCVPDELLVAECVRRDPTMLVVSSVNGHGYSDGLRVVTKLRARPELERTVMVIGGLLGVSESPEERDRQPADLYRAGFDAVFAGGGAADLKRYLEAGQRRTPELAGPR